MDRTKDEEILDYTHAGSSEGSWTLSNEGSSSQTSSSSGNAQEVSIKDLNFEVLSIRDVELDDESESDKGKDDLSMTKSSCSDDESYSDIVEPDSLIEYSDANQSDSPTGESSPTGPELADQTIPLRCAPSRTSLESQKSVSYFVDFDAEHIRPTLSPNVMVQSVIESKVQDRRSFPPATVKGNLVKENSDRMAHSMYARSDSRTSQGSVSFFVDLSTPEISSKGRERRDPNLDSKSRAKPQRNPITGIKVSQFFQKIKEYLDFLEEPCYSKEEVRRKKELAEKLGQILWDGESKVAKGDPLPSPVDLEQTILHPCSKRPISAFFPNEGTQLTNGPKPGLRRERTFDLDPGSSVKDIKVVDINFDESPRGLDQQVSPDLSPDEERDLVVYQKHRILNVRKLKKEVDKLDKIERELVMKASFCGPGPLRCWESPTASEDRTRTPPIPRPRTKIPVAQPQRPSRKCDAPLNHTEQGNTFTTLAVSSRRFQSKTEKFQLKITDPMSASCSGLETTPTSENPPSNQFKTHKASSTNLLLCEREVQTGDSLVRRYKSKQDKGVTVREPPKAFFISCDETENSPTKSKSKVMDLEDTTLSSKTNLQEALKARRPDYIARTKSRENTRLAKKIVQQNRNAIIENIPSNYKSPRAQKCSPLKETLPMASSCTRQPQIRTNQHHQKPHIKSSNISCKNQKNATGFSRSKIPTTTLLPEKTRIRSMGLKSAAPSPYSNVAFSRKPPGGVPNVVLSSKKAAKADSNPPISTNGDGRPSQKLSLVGARGSRLSTLSSLGSTRRVRVP